MQFRLVMGDGDALAADGVTAAGDTAMAGLLNVLCQEPAAMPGLLDHLRVGLPADGVSRELGQRVGRSPTSNR
jgi:hypothetical protein